MANKNKKNKPINLMSYVSENSKEAFNLAYTVSYLDYSLIDNYFIHQLNSPYDNSPLVRDDKKKKLIEIKNKFQLIQDKYIFSNWDNRRNIQLNKLKIWGLLLLRKLNLTDNDKYLQIIEKSNGDNILEVARVVNKLYNIYRSQKTSIYNEKGYINSFFVLALQSILNYFRRDFPRIYNQTSNSKLLWNMSEKNFYTDVSSNNSKVLNQIINISNQPEFLQAIETFVLQTKKTIENNNTTNINKNRNNSNTLEIYKYEQQILDYLKYNKESLPLDILQNTISNEGAIILNKGKLRIGQAIGFSNEDIAGALLEDLSDQLNIDVIISATGKDSKIYTYYGIDDKGNDNSLLKHSAKVTTDIKMAVDINGLQNFLNNNKSNILNNIKSELKSDITNINISAKNYNPDPSKKRNISARSNSNLSIYAAMLSEQLKDNSIYDLLANDNFLKYLILNESVKGRETGNDFRQELSEALSQAGLLVLIDFDTSDEVDFMMIDQNIIPTCLIQEAYIDFLKENNTKLNSFFIMSLKSQTYPTSSSSDIQKVKDVTHLYDRNYLSKNYKIGANQYNSFRFDTHINFDKVFEIIKNKLLNDIY